MVAAPFAEVHCRHGSAKGGADDFHKEEGVIE
jgi:hypothetical protein